MRFEVYCDESRPDLLSSSKSTADYMVIGSLWFEADRRDDFKQAIHQLRDKHRIGGEFKWQKVSPSKLNFYLDLISWFFEQGENLRFRCIAIDHSKVNLFHYHQNDQELGFYKFYYQLIHHWILDFNEYSVFCDFKSNRRRDRLKVLQDCLAWSNLSSTISNVQAVRSDESVLIQLVDTLTGAAAASLNQTAKKNSAKKAVIRRIEENLEERIKHTRLNEHKFNVFVIDLHGGW